MQIYRAYQNLLASGPPTCESGPAYTLKLYSFRIKTQNLLLFLNVSKEA